MGAHEQRQPRANDNEDDNDQGKGEVGSEMEIEQEEVQEQEQEAEEEKLMKALHTILLETQVVEGILVCGNCGHEYPIKESVANFLLPSHLV